MWVSFVALVSVLAVAETRRDCRGTGVVSITNTWNSGRSGVLHVVFPQTVTRWRVAVMFDSAITQMETWIARPLRKTPTKIVLRSTQQNGVQSAGNTLDIPFNYHFAQDSTPPNIVGVKISRVQLCDENVVITTTTADPGIGQCLQSGAVVEHNVWHEGVTGDLVLYFPSHVSIWRAIVTFSRPLVSLEVWDAFVTSTDNMVYELTSKEYNSVVTAGTTLRITFKANFVHLSKIVNVELNGVNICVTNTAAPTISTTETWSTTAATTTAPPATTTESPASTGSTIITETTVSTGSTAVTESTASTGSTTTTESTASTSITTEASTHSPISTPYDYVNVLNKSILFYEAQRSGVLPASNRISWRGDSATEDGSYSEIDLIGGYYDAGDGMKFGFPMASAFTLLSWGAISFEEGYSAAGQTEYLLDSIKWATDYFLKCHPQADVFYGQVGIGADDHAFWGRPEDMTMARPSFQINVESPGSELAAESAAALAAASLVFSSVNPSYSQTLLSHAEQLYDFANTARGVYSQSISDAANFYNSWSGYGDELAWAACWMFMASGTDQYLQDAENHYQSFSLQGRPGEFSWDNKVAGVHVLLHKLTGKSEYRNLVEQFCDWLETSAPRTPQGLVFLQQWGSLRHAANVAFLCLQAAEDGVNPSRYRSFAKSQIGYILGDTGRSFVVGFGNDPPQRPHHRASSCPSPPATCGWDQYNSPDPNPHILYGALVGGPDINDNYQDDRTDFIKNEVAIDYNAGFQGAVAGLLSLNHQGIQVA